MRQNSGLAAGGLQSLCGGGKCLLTQAMPTRSAFAVLVTAPLPALPSSLCHIGDFRSAPAPIPDL